MREILEDAHEHRTDGYGRAQKSLQQVRPKRFYKQASVARMDDGFAVTLDGRPTRTPGRVPVRLPLEALAEIAASEWQAQDTEIIAETMPTVRLLNSAIEAGSDALAALHAEVLKYAANDLLLYRADTPQELAEEQERHWDAALVSLARHLDIKFQPTIGILHQAQPEETLDRLKSAVETTGLFAATAMVSITGLTGSGLLAICLRESLIGADEAWTAAHVDEDYNARLWGEDPEALKRRAKRRIEFDTAVTVLRLAADY